MVPYHPVCGSDYENRTVLKGPLRPIYQTWLEKVMTESGFNYWKLGDQIFIRGRVRHGFDEDLDDNVFDFNPGQIGRNHARVLEAAGEAKAFGMQFDRQQSVDAEVIRDRNGRLTLKRVTWGDIE